MDDNRFETIDNLFQEIEDMSKACYILSKLREREFGGKLPIVLKSKFFNITELDLEFADLATLEYLHILRESADVLEEIWKVVGPYPKDPAFDDKLIGDLQNYFGFDDSE